jgi:hypothetical protein
VANGSSANMSWLWSSLAVINRPSAVTTSTEIRLSELSPCLRRSQPSPPPSVRPAIPVAVTTPSARRVRMPAPLGAHRRTHARHDDGTPAAQQDPIPSGSSRRPSRVSGTVGRGALGGCRGHRCCRCHCRWRH